MNFYGNRKQMLQLLNAPKKTNVPSCLLNSQPLSKIGNALLLSLSHNSLIPRYKAFIHSCSSPRTFQAAKSGLFPCKKKKKMKKETHKRPKNKLEKSRIGNFFNLWPIWAVFTFLGLKRRKILCQILLHQSTRH